MPRSTIDTTAARILRDARDLIATHDTWCQERYRIEWSTGATQRCAIGAVEDAAWISAIANDVEPRLRHEIRERALEMLADALPPWWRRRGESVREDLLRYNDTYSHSAVLRIFDLAIAAQQGAGEEK